MNPLKMPEVLTFGESMILFQPLQEGPLTYNPTFQKTIAGAESNVAIGLSRLGRSVRWISKLGEDPFGELIENTLRGEGIDVSYVTRVSSHPTGVYFKEYNGYGDPSVYYYRKGSAASTLCELDIQDEWFQEVKLLHVTGITPALSHTAPNMALKMMQLAKEKGILVSFDPNLRRKLWDDTTARNTLLQMVSLCDIFLPGMEEAAFLTQQEDLHTSVQQFLKMGPKLVVIKQGEHGAGAHTANEALFAQAVKAKNIVDTVGAGDAFAAGFLSVLLERNGLYERKDVLMQALERGCLMGSLAIQYKGDWEGLPKLKDLSIREAITR